MPNFKKRYRISIKPSDKRGRWVQRENKYDALAAAIILAFKMENDTPIPEIQIEELQERIGRTLRKWDKELQTPKDPFEKLAKKIQKDYENSK